MARRGRPPKAKMNGTHHVEYDDGATLTPDEAETVAQSIEIETAWEIGVATLAGDMRDFILDRLRHEQNKRPWHERSEADQKQTVYQVETACTDLIRRAVEMIAADGRRTIKGTLSQVVVKDGIKGVLEMSRTDEHRHAIMDSVGSTVLIVVADPATFAGERAAVAITPDQPDLHDGEPVFN